MCYDCYFVMTIYMIAWGTMSSILCLNMLDIRLQAHQALVSVHQKLYSPHNIIVFFSTVIIQNNTL